jgi:aminomuconate-semialdehyde/2-hydroxymuconate-6-semialdehyde dehydrogenase
MSTTTVAGVEVDTRHWIGGERVAGAQTFDDVSPLDGEVIATVSRGGQAEVDAAVAAAREAFPEWASTPPAERSAILNRVADGVEKRIEDLAQVETRDNGSLLRSQRAPQPCLLGPGRGHGHRHPVERTSDAGDVADRAGPGRG